MKGFETFYHTIKDNLNDPVDLLISVIHWSLIQDFEYLCIGLQNQDTPQQTSGSELLPSGWNRQFKVEETKINYPTLLYQSSHHTSAFVLLDCFLLGSTLNVTISMPNEIPLPKSSATEKTHSFKVDKDQYLVKEESKSDKISLNSFQPGKLDAFAKLFRDEIEQSMPTSSEQASNFWKLRDDHHKSSNPPSFKEMIPPSANPRSLLDDTNPLVPPIGGADLDPLGRGVGGMLFDPFSDRRIRPPRGMFPDGSDPNRIVPPGARFDPFGPFDGRFSTPDPDHFRAPKGPGFDNYFT